MGLALISVLSAAAVVAAPGAPAGVERAVYSACADLAAHADEFAPAQLRRLAELPPGIVTHAVYRVVRGCPVAEVLIKGQTFYVPSVVQWDGGPVTGSRIARHDHSGE